MRNSFWSFKLSKISYPSHLAQFAAKLIILAFAAVSGMLPIASAVDSKAQNKNKPTPVIMISIDGFRYDYIEKFSPPNITKLARSGVRAKRMIPSYPSKTFPNHITLVTGQYPSNHGIIHNTFYDPALNDIYKMGKAFEDSRWLQSLPIWVYAEQQGIKTASYFWPESDASFDGTKATSSFHYDKSVPYQNRIDQIIDWLKMPDKKKPRLILGYFSLVDDTGHRFGPSSDKTREAVHTVDRYIGQLMRRLKKEIVGDVDLILVSDHGMVSVDPDQSVDWAALADFSDYQVLNGSTQLLVYRKKQQSHDTDLETNELIDHLKNVAQGRFTVSTPETINASLNYVDNPRIPDIILDTKPPHIFVSKEESHRVFKGMHGYDPSTVNEMGALFIASGPDFKRAIKIEPFENIHVFPLIAKLLNLKITNKTDGRIDVLKDILNDSETHWKGSRSH